MYLTGLILLVTYVAGSPLLGSKKCTWGPTYWCSHINHAKECGAVQHCMTTVWQNQIIKVKSDETCTYCMLLVGELRSSLEDKATDEEIAKAIAEACSLLPAGIDRDVCKGIVTDDLPIVMQMLASKITPSVACNIVGFCSVPDEEKQTAEVTAVAKVYVQSTCNDCTKFFQDVQDAITSNETVSQLEQIVHDVLCSRLGSLSEECDDLVKQYLLVALNFLADQIDPNVVCRAFGFCTSYKEPSFKIPLKNVFANRPLIPLKYKSSEECELCKDFVTEIDVVLRDKTIQDKVKYVLETVVCADADWCKQLVEEYLPMLFELLANELDPTTVCETIRLCEVPGRSPNIRPALVMTAAEPVLGGLACTICEDITQELENLLKQNETIQTLEDLVEKVCQRLPDKTLEKKCDDFVKKYGKDVLDYLQKLNPQLICKKLGLCSNQAQEDVRKTKSGDSDDAKCSLCKLGVQELQKVIANMSTEDIITELNKICSYLPGNYSAKCSHYVEQYAAAAIDLLKSSDPQVLCGLIQLCSTSESGVPLLMVPIPEETEKIGVSKECEVCNTIVLVLEELVKQNATEEEIKEELEKMCNLLSEVSVLCKSIIDKYEKQIIEFLLAKLDPYSICKKIGLCKSNMLKALQPALTGILSPVDTLPLQDTKTVHLDTVECEGCEMVVNIVKKEVTANMTVKEFEELLKKACDELPATVSAQCESIVDEYAATILDLLKKAINATEICKEIGFCNSTVKQAVQNQVKKSTIDDTLYFKQHKQLLGKNECTYGPSFWCASEENAKRCKAYEHCQLYVWNRN